MLLAWEASDRAGSAAMVTDEGAVLESVILDSGRAAADLPALLDRLLRTHGQPRALAVAAGPGSFTGLRIAVVAARTLGWSENLPVYPVKTTAALAAAAGPGQWLTVLPLKKDTTFWAAYAVRAAPDRTGLVVEELAPIGTCLDAESPMMDPAMRAKLAHAVVIGPALASKPDLAATWFPGHQVGSSAACRAVGVACAATSLSPQPWAAVDVAYHRASAPELQRQQQQQQQQQQAGHQGGGQGAVGQVSPVSRTTGRVVTSQRITGA